jgi:hypothetical protein
VALNHDAVSVDLLRFRACLAEGRWIEALELDRGPVLPEVHDEWVEELREQHTADVIRAIVRAGAEAESEGKLIDAVAFARAWVRLEPLSEVAGRSLVRLLSIMGDRAAAVEAGKALTERLHYELGVAPDAETSRLLAGVRSGDSGPATQGLDAREWHRHAFVPRVVENARTDLVGRDTALSQLRDTLHGEARVVVVAGDAGIGKTSLTLVAALDAVRHGATVLFGRCDEEAVVPFSPWVEALGQLVGELDESGQQAVLAEGGADLLRLLPELDQGGRYASGDVEPDTQRWRLFEAVSRVLSAAAASRQMLLVLDDMHWADRSSLLLLRHLLRTRAQLPVTVVMTARDAELSDEHPLQRVLAQLRREEAVVSISLQGLGEPDVAELIRRRRGNDASHDLARALHQETEGNPFFVEEFLRSSPRRHPQPGTAPQFDMPDSVADVVRRRLHGLGDEVRQVLDQAAVMGRDFELTSLEAAVESERVALVNALDRAVGAQLVDEVGVGCYSFRHALIRATLYTGLTQTRRSLLHLRAARALEALRGGSSQVRASSIAHHYLESGDPSQVDAVVDSVGPAYLEAMDQFAYEDAATLVARARQALTAVRQSDDRILTLLNDEGEALSRAGDFDSARVRFLEATGLGRTHGDGVAFGNSALGFAGPSWRNFGVVDSEGVALLQEALEAAPGGEQALKARLEARLAMALYFGSPPEVVSELAASAVKIARELGDHRVLAAALEAKLWSTWRPDSVAERLLTAEELLQVAVRIGADEIATGARRWRVVALLELGQMEELWKEVTHHARDAERLSLPYELMYVAVFDTMRAFLEGRLTDAAAGSARVAAFGELRGGADALQFGGVHALVAGQLEGNLSALVDGLAYFAATYPALPAWRSLLAYVLVMSGSVEEAAEQVEALWPPEEVFPPTLCGWWPSPSSARRWCGWGTATEPDTWASCCVPTTDARLFSEPVEPCGGRCRPLWPRSPHSSVTTRQRLTTTTELERDLARWGAPGCAALLPALHQHAG